MNDGSNALEGLRLVSDWSKWLITIETGAITIIGAAIRVENRPILYLANICATASIICFLISIAAAAILLLTLPEIAQMLRPNMNIWLTQDSIAGQVFHLNTQSLAILESFFFGIGMICFSALIITLIWLPKTP